MSDENDTVRRYLYGEAYDDLRTAFYVDPRAYGSRRETQLAADEANEALTRFGVIYEIEFLHVDAVGVDAARPGWEEFKRRHVIDGVPLPVRPRVPGSSLPPAWHAMHQEIEGAYERFLPRLIALAEAAFPDCPVHVRYVQGPRRVTSGSVDRSEEGYGFDVHLGVQTGDRPREKMLDALDAALVRDGWQTARSDEQPLTATRDGFSVATVVAPGRLTLVGKSPLYSAPPAPETRWRAEPRP